MLSPKTLDAVERLLSAYHEEIFAPEDVGAMLSDLVTGENLPALIEQLPGDLVPAFHRALVESSKVSLDGDHFEPEDSPFDGDLNRYYGILRAALCSTEDHERVLAIVLCMPSFEPEWSL